MQIALILALLQSVSAFADNAKSLTKCEQSLIQSVKPQRFLEEASRKLSSTLDFSTKETTPKKRSPKNALTVDGIFLFGFESEYTLDRSEKLLSLYGPDSSFNISIQAWLERDPRVRVKWVEENLDKIFPQIRVNGGLVKINRESQWDFLPERLILDSTGNLEIVLPPVQSLETWYAQVTKINESLEAGSMQATVGLRRL